MKSPQKAALFLFISFFFFESAIVYTFRVILTKKIPGIQSPGSVREFRFDLNSIGEKVFIRDALIFEFSILI